MNLSDLIQIIGIIAATVTSIISILIALFTLRQNNKMIEDSSRPYILISYEVIHSREIPTCHLVLKNYGQTGAKITGFQYDCEISDKDILYQFNGIVGTFLAPSQKKLYFIDPRSFSTKEVTFQISYKTEQKTYQDTVRVKVGLGALTMRDQNNANIPCSLQEISERLL